MNVLVVRAAPAMAAGAAGVEPAGGAEKVTAAKHIALETKAYGEAWSRHETPPQAEAARGVETPPPEGKRTLNEPPEGWRRPEALRERANMKSMRRRKGARKRATQGCVRGTVTDPAQA